MRWHAALLVAVLATGALAVPTGSRGENKCAASCVDSDSAQFAYEAGRTYVYDYSSDVETTLAGATDEASRLHVAAVAELTANSGCDLTLQLREVTLKESDPKDAYSKQDVENMAAFKQELERWPLSFSSQDGRIEELCSNPSEPVWVLNFKRGLLSAYVNSLSSLEPGEFYQKETDVTGRCGTEYAVTEHGSAVLVTKTRDLLSCPGRGHLISSLQSTPYSSGSEVQSLPLIRSTLKCEQKVSEGRVRSAECVEQHLFRPFSEGENGAVTRSTVRLTETAVRSAATSYDQDMPTLRSSLLFDYADAELQQQNRLQAAASLLTQLEEKTADGVRPDVPRLFTRLVRTLRHFDEAGLLQLEAQLVAGEARRFFVDALPLAGSAPAMALMRRLMQRGQVDEQTADRWMTALAFVHEPSLEMVAAVAPLLAEPGARRQTLLGVSSLVHHYCERHVDCAEQSPVREAVGHLERALGSGCRAGSEHEELRVLAALKALGNAGRLSGGVAPLRSCFEAEASLEVRLAAIRAMRRMPCDAVADSGMMNLFADERENTEVRIAAYLAIMQCPTRDIVDKVQEILSGETVNQVSSFVWSHLTNMQETNDPTKRYMKSLLYNMDLAKKFSTDVRKFSRYFEKTMFSSSMNAGATVDGSIIFSPESYIPRSGALNFTFDLFGQAINLLEVGGRVEGLEDLSESLFGNNGIYPQEAISQILKTVRGRNANDLATYTSGQRIQSPQASAYLKIFGNELKFDKFDSFNELVNSLGANGPLDFLQKLAKDMDWTENYQFLDSTYTVPTIAGFPFSLKAVGTAAVSLKTGGSYDIESWSKMNINGFIKPSAAVEIVGEMTVDAHVAHTGLKMSTNLHTSTVVDGHAIVDSGKLVSVRINMPRNKVEVLDVTTRFHSVFRNRARKLEMNKGNHFELMACSDSLGTSDLLGVNFCADISYSRSAVGMPSCFISGPMTARFIIEKTDTFKAFEFEYRHSNTGGIRKSNLVFDTAGSAVDRRITVDYMVNFESNAFQAGFRTPIKSMDVSGSLKAGGPTKKLDLSLKMDDQEVFGVSSSLVTEDTADTLRYSPSISVRSRRGELVNLDGDFMASWNKRKYNVQLSITKLYQTPIVLKGSLNEVDGTYNIASSMESYLLDGKMKGYFRFAGDNLLIQTNTEYAFLEGEKQTITVTSKMSKTTQDDLTTYRLFMDSKFSALPMLDGQLTLERQVSSTSSKNQLVLLRGERHYELHSALSYPDRKVAASVGFLATHWDIDFKLAGSVDMEKDDMITFEAEAKLNEAKFIRGSLALNYKHGDGFHYGVSTSVTVPNAKYALRTGVRQEQQAAKLMLVAERQTATAHDELALVARVECDEGETSAELTLSVPNYPRLQATGRLVAGAGGVYLARAGVQGGQRRYSIGAEYKAKEEHVLELLLEAPGRRYSALVSAMTDGEQPRAKADIRFGRRVTAALSTRPYGFEKTASFEILWNKDVDDSQKATLDLVMDDDNLDTSLVYPGRSVKLSAKRTDRGVSASLLYAPGKVIHVVSEVQQTGFNGFSFFVNINTPIEGFTTMSLNFAKKSSTDKNLVTFEASGKIEEQEMLLTGHVEVDLRRFMTEHSIKAEFDLTTPFATWRHSQITINHYVDANTVTAYVSATKDEERFALGGTFEMFNQPDVFKVSTSVEIALPTDLLRTAKLGFDLKVGDAALDTGVLVRWSNPRENELSLTLNSKHSVRRDVAIDTIVTLKTPFENFEQLSAALKINKDYGKLFAEFEIKQVVDEIFHTQLNLLSSSVEGTSGRFLLRCAKCRRFEAMFEETSSRDMKFRVSLHGQGSETSLTGRSFASGPNESGALTRRGTVTLVLPTHTYELIHNMELDTTMGTVDEYTELRRDDQKVAISIKSKWTQTTNSEGRVETITLNGYGTVTTPFEGWESCKISHETEISGLTTGLTATSQTKVMKGDKMIEVTDNVRITDALNWELRREVVSNSRWLSSASGLLKLDTLSAGENTLTASASWDGDTAEFVYSHILPVGFYSTDFKMSVTAKWFGGVTRTLKIAVPFTPEEFKPSVTITYDSGKTMQVYGVISRNVVSGESRLTLEAPFTETMTLTVGHSCEVGSKKAKIEYSHGNKHFSADVKAKYAFPAVMKVEIDFESPRSCMGSGSASMEYELDNELDMEAKVSRNDWAMSLKGELGVSKGHVDINTPYRGYTLLSASYAVSSNDAEIRLKRENNQILIVANRQRSHDMLTYSARLNTPVYGYESMVLTVSKPSGEDRVTAEYQRGRRASVSVTADYAFSGPSSSVSVEAQTSYDGLSTASLHLSYNLVGQTGRAMFAAEDRKVETRLAAELGKLFSKMAIEYENDLLPGPKQVTLTGMYNVQDDEKSLEVVIMKDADKYAFMGDAQLTAKSSFLKLDVETPIGRYEAMKFAAGYDMSDHALNAKFEMSKNSEALEATFRVQNLDDTGKVVLSVKTPFEGFRHRQLSAEYDVSSNAVLAKLIAEVDGGKSEINASLREEDDAWLLTVTTPFSGLEELGVEVGLSSLEGKNSAHLVLFRNQEQIRASLETELSWGKSTIALTITTPMREAQTVRFILRYDLLSDQKNFFVFLSRNDLHVKLNSLFVLRHGSGNALIELESPFANYENVKYEISYDVTRKEKFIDVSVERNGVKKAIAGRGSYDGEAAYLDIVTPMEGYERMGINGHYVSRRGKRSVGYDAHVNDHRHRVYVLYEREGMESAKLRIESPIKNMELVEVDLRSQTFPDGVGYYINTNRDGKRSSAEIRTVKDDNSVGVDVSIKSHFEGLENLQLSGNVVYRGRKRSFSFTSDRGSNKAEVSGEVVMKKRSGNGSLKAMLPVEGLENVDVTFDYKLGKKKSFQLTSIRGGVTREFSGDLQYSDTSFTVNLNTPYKGFKKLHADATRTQAADGRIAAEINLQRGSRKIAVSYDYLFSKSSGSGSVHVSTPYEGFSEMMTSLEYNIGANSRSVSFKAKRDAREWSLETSRSWENGVDQASLVLTSPIDEIKSVKVSRTFNIQDLSAMTYDASYERNGKRFALSGTGGIESDGAKVSFDITVTTPLEIKELGAKVSYDFTQNPRTISAHLTAGNRYANLDATLGDSEGTMKLVTTNPKLPSVDITYSATIADNLRDITANLVLADGRTLALVYKADYTKPNHGEGLIKLTSTTFGERTLNWDYHAPDDDLTGSIVYSSPNGKAEWTVSVDGKRFVQRKIVIKSEIESPWFNASRNLVIRYNTRNVLYFKGRLDSDGKIYKLVLDAKEKKGKRVVSLEYDGQLVKDLKIGGTWTIPKDLESRKEFDITYKRGDREGTLSGFVLLGSSGLSGSFDVHLTTPFEQVADLKVNGNWDVVLPNRIVRVNYNRNGRRFELDITGTRQEKHGDYSFSLSMPPVEIQPGKAIDQIKTEFSFDFRNGYKIRAAQKKPLDEVLELELKMTDTVRTVKALYRLEDREDLVKYMPESVYVEFNSKRTERSQGPRIELELKTGFPGFEKIDVDIDVNRGADSSKVTVDYKRGDKVGRMSGEVRKTEAGGSVSFNVNTPIPGFEDVSASGSYEFLPYRSYGLNIDYSRGQKFVRLTSSAKLDIQKQDGELRSGSIDLDIKFDSMVTKPVDLTVTLDGSVETQPRRSGNGKLVATLNGKAVTVTYAVGRAEAGRRTAKVIVTTPLKQPFKKMVYTSDVSLTSNKADFSFEYGKKKISLDLSWFAGEARQYGVEVRLNTPYKPVQSLELDVKTTVHPDQSTDVLVHYRRGEKMVHVTGNVQPWPIACDFDFETPTFGNFNVKGGFFFDKEAQSYSAKGLVTLQSGAAAGGEVTVKATSSKDMQLTIDIQTPVEGWERLNLDVAYTNTDSSNIVRVAFESPATKRVEVSFELTNNTSDDRTDFRAGVTTNYLGNAFTFRTNIQRNASGMKYELEIESPFHIIPSFKLTGTR